MPQDLENEDCPDCRVECYVHEVVVIFNRPDVSTFDEAVKTWQKQKIPLPEIKLPKNAIID